MTSCGADTLSNTLLTSLLDGKSFPIPTVDLSDGQYAIPPATGPAYATVTKLDNEALTTGAIDGTGAFDAIMRSLSVHLKAEYNAGRITGAEYAKAYIALTESALGNATQYLLGREQAYWDAIGKQLQAQALQVSLVTARVQHATAKAQFQSTSYEALTNEATYGLAKLKLATEDIGYCTAKYNLDFMLPIQKTVLEKQRDLTTEQVEAQRAQTWDTHVDGSPIVGVMGKQKDLYAQQITSYKRDAEAKAAKIFTDAWITMKTMDEGLLPPTNFQNESINVVLGKLKTNNELT